jgi:hypothetical protein
MTRRISEAEARFLATRDQILARRNPELLAREKAEFEAMSDEELQAAAYPWGPPARRRGVLAWLGRGALRLGEVIEKLGRRLVGR